MFKDIISSRNLYGDFTISEDGFISEKVPYWNDYGTDANGNKYITVEIIETAQELASLSQYAVSQGTGTSFEEYQNFTSSLNRISEIDTAINEIIFSQDTWSVTFSDVAKIAFTSTSDISTGDDPQIIFGQLNGTHSRFSGPSGSSATAYTITYEEDTDPIWDVFKSETHGDIFINTDHANRKPVEDASGETYGDPSDSGKNVWEDYGDIDQGTYAYKVLLEETAHTLGIDVIDLVNFGFHVSSASLATQKYSITAYASIGQKTAWINDVNSGQTVPVTIEDSDPASRILYGDDYAVMVTKTFSMPMDFNCTISLRYKPYMAQTH